MERLLLLLMDVFECSFVHIGTNLLRQCSLALSRVFVQHCIMHEFYLNRSVMKWAIDIYIYVTKNMYLSVKTKCN